MHQPVTRSTSASDEAAVLLELPGDSLMVKVPPAQEQQRTLPAEPVSSKHQPEVETEHSVRQQEVERVPPVQQQKVEGPAMAMLPARDEGSTQAGGADGDKPAGAPPVPVQAAPDLQCSMQSRARGRVMLRSGLLTCAASTPPCCPWRKVQLRALLHSCSAAMLAAEL